MQICSEQGEVKVVPIDAKELHGYFSIEVPTLHLYDSTMDDFKELIQLVDVMCIFEKTDCTLIEFNINDIFIKTGQ
jgi:hypothetical protein